MKLYAIYESEVVDEGGGMPFEKNKLVEVELGDVSYDLWTTLIDELCESSARKEKLRVDSDAFSAVYMDLAMRYRQFEVWAKLLYVMLNSEEFILDNDRVFP